jgi:hypothetical protein
MKKLWVIKSFYYIFKSKITKNILRC